MKKASALITVILVIAVLLTALGIGVGIREVRQKNKAAETKVLAEPGIESRRPGIMPERGGRDRFGNLSEQERAGQREQRGGRRPGEGREGRGMFQMLSPEEAAKMREQWPNMSEQEREKFRDDMRQRWENMSDEEREATMARMRERFSGRRGPGGERGPGGRLPGERDPFRNLSEQERAELREKLASMSEQERREYFARMRGEPNSVRDTNE